MPDEQIVPSDAVSFPLQDAERGKYDTLITRAAEVSEGDIYIITIQDEAEVSRYRSGLSAAAKRRKITVHFWQVNVEGLVILRAPRNWPRRYAVIVKNGEPDVVNN